MTKLRFIWAMAALASLGLIYQNCAPAGTGNAFVLTSNAVTLGASPILLTAANLQPGASFSATATIVAAKGSTFTCDWIILNSGNLQSATVVAPTSDTCAVTANAPMSLGTYTLSLVVTDNNNHITKTNIDFQVSNTAPPPSPTPIPTSTPTPTATPSPTPSGLPSGTQCASGVNYGSSCYGNPPSPTVPYTGGSCGQCSSHNNYPQCQPIPGCYGILVCSYRCS